MSTFWETLVQLCTLVVLLSGGGALFARWLKRQNEVVHGAVGTLSKVVGGLVEESNGDGNGELAAKLAQIERRMEQLEQDALSYLRKGSQRYEQARRREARIAEQEGLDPDEVQQTASDHERDQLELALGRGEPPQEGFGATLEQIRALIARG